MTERFKKRARSGADQAVGDRLPPHSIEDEQAALGSILLDPSTAVDAALDLLPAGGDSFYDVRHQDIYLAILHLRSIGKPVDLLTLSGHLKQAGQLESVGGFAYISGLQDVTPSAANLPVYAAEIAKHHKARNVLRSVYEAVERIYSGEDPDAVINTATTSLDSIAHAYDTAHVVTAKEAVREFADNLQARAAMKGRLGGIATGFDRLDSMLDGLQRGEMAVVAARPSIGKTAFGMNVVDNACLYGGVKTLIVSCEMRVYALMRRLAACHLDIPIKDMKTGQLNEGQFRKLTAFVGKLKTDNNVFFYSAGRKTNCLQIASVIRQHARKHGVQLVMLDYLQKVRGSTKFEKRTDEIAEVSSVLYEAAQSANVALLCLAQVNRESEKGSDSRPPKLSELRESGAIEQDADTVCILHRDRTPGKQHIGSIAVAKQRDGEIGAIGLDYQPEIGKFTEARKSID